MSDIAVPRYLRGIPRKLHALNIDSAIQNYKALLLEGPVEMRNEKTPYDFIKAIKREKLTAGPYAGVSLFEAANRIMSDLVILFGVQYLLKENFDGVSFAEFDVCFGNESKLPHDVNAQTGEYYLSGEAFNVAESFFYTKRKSALEKLLKNEAQEKRFLILLYNDDATTNSIERNGNVFHVPVTVRL